jgi:RNA 2',3'-cyclic 3'-phosphodiesterase
MPVNHLKRVFFALWPDDPVRDEISNIFKKSIYANSSGQVYCSENLHLTLHFLGNLTPSEIDCALQQAAKVDVDKFELSLDSFGCFERPKILWLGPKEAPNYLTELHLKLANALDVCRVPIESRSYQPHVTLMRKFKGFKESQVSHKVLWKVKQFALVESISTNNGVEYRPLRLYSLRG